MRYLCENDVIDDVYDLRGEKGNCIRIRKDTSFFGMQRACSV